MKSNKGTQKHRNNGSPVKPKITIFLVICSTLTLLTQIYTQIGTKYTFYVLFCLLSIFTLLSKFFHTDLRGIGKPVTSFEKKLVRVLVLLFFLGSFSILQLFNFNNPYPVDLKVMPERTLLELATNEANGLRYLNWIPYLEINQKEGTRIIKYTDSAMRQYLDALLLNEKSEILVEQTSVCDGGLYPKGEICLTFSSGGNVILYERKN
jgi:hypothetical protein